MKTLLLWSLWPNRLSFVLCSKKHNIFLLGNIRHNFSQCVVFLSFLSDHLQLKVISDTFCVILTLNNLALPWNCTDRRVEGLSENDPLLLGEVACVPLLVILQGV